MAYVHQMSYSWEVQKKHIVVNFACHVGITYCTISVLNPNRLLEHYHNGTVYNPMDVYNMRTGMFIAFKKTLRLRWDDKHWRNSEYVWRAYHEKWSHYLAALMDGNCLSEGKVFDGNDLYSL